MTEGRKKELYLCWIEESNNPLHKDWRENLTEEERELIAILDSGVPIVNRVLFERISKQISREELDRIFGSLGNQKEWPEE